MIRCIPVDGSEAFEVDDHEILYRYNDETERRQASWLPGLDGDQRGLWRLREGLRAHKRIKIESWRERAERLEREMSDLRAELSCTILRAQSAEKIARSYGAPI